MCKIKLNKANKTKYILLCPPETLRPTRNTAVERFVNRHRLFRTALYFCLLPRERGKVLEELDVVLGPGLVPLDVLGEGEHAAAPPVPGARQQHQLVLHLPREVLASRPVKSPGTCNKKPVNKFMK